MIKSTFSVKTIGSILREKRRDKGLRLKQVAEITRIRMGYLKALEQGDYSSFPSEVYIKGFLKNYAKFLGIDQDKALAMYRRENSNVKETKIEEKKLRPRRFDFTLTPEKLILLIVSIITIGIVYYIGTRVSTILQKPDLSITSPVAISADQKGEHNTAEARITIKGKISAGANLKLNGDDVLTNNLEQFEVRDLELNPGKNEFIFVAESQFGRETRVSLTINSTATPAAVEGGTTQTTPGSSTNNSTSETGSTNTGTTNPTDKIQASITIVNDIANVLVIADGNTKINQVLNPGTTKTYSAKTDLIIQSPRPTNLKVTINGKNYTITSSARQEWKVVSGKVTKIH